MSISTISSCTSYFLTNRSVINFSPAGTNMISNIVKPLLYATPDTVLASKAQGVSHMLGVYAK